MIMCVMIMMMFVHSSCRKSMDELNVNPNAPDQTNPDYLFTYSVYSGMGTYITDVNLQYWNLQNWDMYFATLGGVDAGKEYLANDGKDQYWKELYSRSLINAHEVLRLTNNDPYLRNKNLLAQIWMTYLFQQLTDLWGSIPYSNALKGYPDLNYSPSYDRQQDIYTDLLIKLKNAAAELDANKISFPGTSDPIYSGNIDRWKAFANSLRLRAAMRIRFSDPSRAQQEISDLQGKPMISSNSMNAIFPYNSDLHNPLFDLDNSGQSGGKTYPSKFLIDQLKSTNDPRIKVFARYTTESLLIGAPDYNGVPNLLPANDAAWNNYHSDGSNVSKIGSWFLRQDAPGMLMSYAEVCFLQAEASLLGWWNGNAQQLFADGVRANMESYSGSGLTTSEINNYVNALPTVSVENILREKWISFTYQNGIEAYSEYRRTGFPVLTDYSGNPVNQTQFPKRLTYPSSEVSLNSINYHNANAEQGPDIASTSVWWDQ